MMEQQWFLVFFLIDISLILLFYLKLKHIDWLYKSGLGKFDLALII